MENVLEILTELEERMERLKARGELGPDGFKELESMIETIEELLLDS